MPASVEDRLHSLERLSEALVEQPKAFAIIFAAIFGALPKDSPETLKKITEHLQDSLADTANQHAHLVVRSELSQTVNRLVLLLKADD